MSKTRAAPLSAEATRRNQEQTARLGGEVGETRRRKRLTQRELGARVGVSQAAISDLERGRGSGHTLDTWQRIALAVGRPLRVELERDREGETADAGHLGMQELVLRTGRKGGWDGSFELPAGMRGAGAGSSRHSTDIALRSDRRRVVVLVECWNTIDDLGAAARSSGWKAGQAEQAGVAAAPPGQPPYRVATCWVVRSTNRNRALIDRYPEIISRRFPGSSAAWLRAVETGAEPPAQPGLIWCDPDATRVFARRAPRPKAATKPETPPPPKVAPPTAGRGPIRRPGGPR